MKFFSNRWSSTPIGRHSPHRRCHLRRSISSAPNLVKISYLDILPSVNKSSCLELSLNGLQRNASVFRHMDQRLPVRSRPQALQDVDLIGIRADQDTRLTSFDPAQNPCRSHFRGSPEQLFKTSRFLFES